MTTDPRLVVRSVLVYALCIPLAIFLGYMLAGQLSYTSLISIGSVFAFLLLPALLRWHYPILVLSWNTIAVLPFIPGRPQLRLLLVGVSLIISLLVYALDRRKSPLNVRSITFPLVALLAAVFTTMALTGGAGFGSLGAGAGGAGRYVMLFGGILGYFAISAQRVPMEKARLYVALFFLGGLTLTISSLATILPSWMDYLFLVFPVEDVFFRQGPAFTGTGVGRIYGVASAALLATFYMLARFGIRGILSTAQPWRAIVFLTLAVGVVFGGFRSFMLSLMVVVLLQLYLEGYFKLKYLPAWLVALLMVLCIWPLADKLPYRVQRSLAFLPKLPVANEVYLDVRGSSDWRLEIWRRVWREFLNDDLRNQLVGKGYKVETRAMDTLVYTKYSRTHDIEQGEMAELVSDFHSGPLSIIVPLGILGTVAVIWFWIAAWRLLLHNYRNSPPELKMVNTLFLAYFGMRVFHFVVIFGNFYSEFAQFTGIVGLSVAINGGLARVETVPEAVEEPSIPPMRSLRPRLQPVISTRG